MKIVVDAGAWVCSSMRMTERVTTKQAGEIGVSSPAVGQIKSIERSSVMHSGVFAWCGIPESISRH